MNKRQACTPQPMDSGYVSSDLRRLPAPQTNFHGLVLCSQFSLVAGGLSALWWRWMMSGARVWHFDSPLLTQKVQPAMAA